MRKGTSARWQAIGNAVALGALLDGWFGFKALAAEPAAPNSLSGQWRFGLDPADAGPIE